MKVLTLICLICFFGQVSVSFANDEIASPAGIAPHLSDDMTFTDVVDCVATSYLDFTVMDAAATGKIALGEVSPEAVVGQRDLARLQLRTWGLKLAAMSSEDKLGGDEPWKTYLGKLRDQGLSVDDRMKLEAKFRSTGGELFFHALERGYK